jgi:hypothetical protein
MGLAYGLSPRELGMDKVIVSADRITRRITREEYEKIKAEEAAAKKPQKAKKEAAAEETNN